ncbi:hypothetical protein DWB61_07540 [Ancylomarina euxinus]|uniref:Uncharacterized protein n=1 Tax=Ancylomarina euxinus TaxID=2283627 RepID=A0A425Y2G7_9BACT|nr:hypothetical protein DWB61_07540 [Ancylomarina euxinus]
MFPKVSLESKSELRKTFKWPGKTFQKIEFFLKTLTGLLFAQPQLFNLKPNKIRLHKKNTLVRLFNNTNLLNKMSFFNQNTTKQINL